MASTAIGPRGVREGSTHGSSCCGPHLQLEQQALKHEDMNRHFVFNALNSIQYHINKQDSTTASRYLTSFAKLIRKNLDASQYDTAALTEELERLELYLVLERMRFKDKFRYTITVDPSVDMNQIRLPAMMLQPSWRTASGMVSSPCPHRAMWPFPWSRERARTAYSCGSWMTRIKCGPEHALQIGTRGRTHISRGVGIDQRQGRCAAEA